MYGALSSFPLAGPAGLVLLLALSACTADWSEVDADGDGFSISAGDCWDRPAGPEGTGLSGADIHPQAAETWYDGFDQDCLGGDDYDADLDGFVQDQHLGLATWGASGTGALPGGDCWDDPASLSPVGDPVPGTTPVAAGQTWPGAADAWYDGVDQDCGGDSDFDADLDGWDSAEDAQADGTRGPDCDDADPALRPDAVELCDDVDNDCDALVDGADPDVDPSSTRTWYGDADGDGYGLDEDVQVACDQPEGFVERSGDCQDDDPQVNPLADELCNGIDDDCNGAVDEAAADAPLWYLDADLDGFGDPEEEVAACLQPEGYVDDDRDCADGDPAVNPGQVERCATRGVDDDCDGTADDGDAVDAATWYQDIDGDGWGLASVTTRACDAPAATAAIAGDCDDGRVDVHPEMVELCATAGVDDDCDGAVDDAAAADAGTWYIDGDGDGHGQDAGVVRACALPDGAADRGGDCDDGRADVNPDMVELCATVGVDDDCDGAIDDLSAVDLVTWYADLDGDGYGDPGTAELACQGGEGAVSEAGDCDDTCEECWTGAEEVCNDGVDNNCDGTPDHCASLEAEIDLADVALRVQGAAVDDKAGRAIAAGDLDGDGQPDLLLGAVGAGSGGTAYGLLGPISSATTVGAASLSATGVESADNAGRSVALVDIDGDGLDDALITAPDASAGGNNRGALYVLYGPAAGALSLADADWVVEGEGNGDYLGRLVTGVGDLGGDGVEDLVVTGIYVDLALGNDGAALLIDEAGLGTDDGEDIATATLYGAAAEDNLGSAASAAGDHDGDGLADLVLGASRNDAAGTDAGAVSLFLGPIEGTWSAADADATWTGEDGSDRAGDALHGGLDVDGDGLADLVVGAYKASSGGEGAAWLVPGAAAPSGGSLAASAAVVRGTSSNQKLGISVALLADMDGDGRAEVGVGDGDRDDCTATSAPGQVYLFLGGLSGSLTGADADIVIRGDADGDCAGAAVLDVGDLSGDGARDLALGAPGVEDRTGAVYILEGGGI